MLVLPRSASTNQRVSENEVFCSQGLFLFGEVKMDNKQKKIAFIGVLLLGCVATSWLQEPPKSRPALQAPTLAQQLAGERSQAKQSKTMQVYVNGAVQTPGIYTLPAGARTMDALEAAGGLRPEAKADRVNLAKKLRDGSQVYVPFVKNNGGSRPAAQQSSAPRVVGGSGGSSTGKGSVVGTGRKVNLNTATQEELMALPGVGEATALRIMALRKVQPFRRVEDLLQVRGIGQTKLEKLRPYVTVM